MKRRGENQACASIKWASLEVKAKIFSKALAARNRHSKT